MSLFDSLDTESTLLISFFVPCYNEELNIKNTLDVIKESAARISYEVIVVDDGSTDLTSNNTEQYIANNPDMSIRLVKRKKNIGLGANYFESANIANGSYFMLVNGDNVEPVDALKAIISKAGQTDMVIPNFGDGDKREWNRKLLSMLFTAIVNFLSGNNIRYYNGPVLHRTENVRTIEINAFGYGYQAELLCKLLGAGATYAEVVVPNGDRQWGASKAFAPKNFVSVAASLYNIVRNRISS